MRKTVSILILLGLFALVGCVLQTSCKTTVDCPPDQICSNGHCTKTGICREINQTCDVDSNCCTNLKCQDNKCTPKTCPSSCNDFNNCTRDSCDQTTNFTCKHTAISSCSGDGKCEQGENCANSADCPCNAINETCVDTKCVSVYTSKFREIDNRYNMSICYDQIDLYWDHKEYSQLRSKIEECRQKLINYRDELSDLAMLPGLTEKEKNETEVRVLYTRAIDKYWSYLYKGSYINEKLGSEEEYTTQEYLADLKEALFELRTDMYYLWLIKSNYPSEWGEKWSSEFDGAAETYKSTNQLVNDAYDTYGSWDYKYSFQVDPTDPIVVDKVDNLTEGLTDEQEISEVLYEYVRDNVKYKYDPNWQTDWVQPPIYTLMVGEGDCDDHAVLLASMLLRAGMDAELCEAAVSSPQIDHLTVKSGNYIYDATWKDETPFTVSEYQNMVYELDCYSPQDVQEYANAPKCTDGTLYGYCSSVVEGAYCTDYGELVDGCSLCGCGGAYPYCGSDDVCFSCNYGYEGYPGGNEGGFCCKRGFSAYIDDNGDGYCCEPGTSAWIDARGRGFCCPEDTYGGTDGNCYYY